MQQLTINLSISPEQYLSYYQGHAQQVVAKSMEGVTVAFPADRLRPFISHHGIHGQFKITFDHNHKLLQIVAL